MTTHASLAWRSRPRACGPRRRPRQTTFDHRRSAPPSRPQSQSSDASTRPATTTFFGDTGLWFVPTGEVLPHGKWSVSGYRRGTNYIQGYTNVADFAGTFAVGIKRPGGDLRLVPLRHAHRSRRAAALRRRSDVRRHHRSLSARQPRLDAATTSATSTSARRSTSGRSIRQKPVALARARHRQAADRRTRTSASAPARPTGSVDFIVSKEIGEGVEVSGYAGYEFRGKPGRLRHADRRVPLGRRRRRSRRASPLRVFRELNGYMPSSDTATITTATLLVGIDGSRRAAASRTPRT